MTLSMEIVTPGGTALVVEDVVEIVFRRREERFESGSEVAIFPGHAPLAMQTSAGSVRWKDRKDVLHKVEVTPGLVEVLDDSVLVVTDSVVTQAAVTDA